MKILGYTGRGFRYFGLSIPVHEWTKYLATNENGDVYAFDTKPFVNDLSKTWTYLGSADSKCSRVAIVDLEGVDWTNTLVEY